MCSISYFSFMLPFLMSWSSCRYAKLNWHSTITYWWSVRRKQTLDRFYIIFFFHSTHCIRITATKSFSWFGLIRLWLPDYKENSLMTQFLGFVMLRVFYILKYWMLIYCISNTTSMLLIGCFRAMNNNHIIESKKKFHLQVDCMYSPALWGTRDLAPCQFYAHQTSACCWIKSQKYLGLKY